MSGFGSNPTTGTQGALSTNQFPLSSVAEPGRAAGDLTALEGGPGSVDSNSNRTAPVSMYVKDGGDVTQGTSTDANTANTIMGRLTKIRDLLNATITVGGTITEANSASIKSDLDTINTAIGAISDAAWSGSGNGSEIAILKKIVAELAATLTVSGTVTANAGTGSFTVAQATGSNLHTVLDAGSAVIGHVINDASSAVIGHVIADTGSTTAVTQATASNLNAQVVGSVASGASNAGNPVKDGGVFNTTQPTVTTGQVVDAQYTARGAALVATGVDAFAVNASQTGTWNVTNVSGTVSLPTGASTSAKQPALGTAGSASADVITVQGITSMTALKTDGSGVTQPVSGTVTATSPVSATGTPTSVAASATAVALLASNASRKAAALYNDSSATLYVGLFAHASLTTGLYTTQVPPNNLYELPVPPVYTGEISGIWSSATGNARITELT